MKVLVTGGTGFLGKRLAWKLKALGYDVSVSGRNFTIGKELSNQGLQFLPVDLTETEPTIATCQGQDYVFHCAALCSPWGKYRYFYNANVLGTRNIIKGCQTHGVKRLIHVSTPSVCFNFSHRLNIAENEPLAKQPANNYAKTKLLAEAEINQAHQQGLPVITIRPRGIFGPGDTTVLPRLIKASNQTGIPLINAGKACIDMTYVDNVVDALLLCQNADDSCLGKIYNITNDEPMRLADLLEMLSQKLGYSFKYKPISYPIAYWVAAAMEAGSNILLFGKEPVLTRYTVGLLAFDQTLDITAAKLELGYQPKIKIEEGLDIFTQWWKTNN